MNKIISFFSNLIFKGQIPFFKFIKIGLSLLPLIALVTFIDLRFSRDFANYGWNFLLITIFARPVAAILPKLGILRRIVLLRRQLGIISGTFILAHGLSYFLAGQITFIDLFNPQIWDFQTFLPWGILGFIICILVLLTSNNISMRFLGKWWKQIQRFSYLFLIFGGIHIFLQKKDISILVELSLWILVWIFAHFKIIIWKEKKTL